MRQFRIAHLSDIHVLKEYGNSFFNTHLKQPVPPAAFFLAALRQAMRGEPDVIVITGDLVHEGTEGDYAYLHEIIRRETGETPVLLTLGNHDFKSCFYKGYLGENREGPYYRKAEIGGYRFCMLDTATEKSPNGAITDEQADWLEEVLRTPSQNGTILLGHHPLESRQAWFHTTYPERLLRTLEQSDVIAYLCGHSHYGEFRIFHNIPQVTAESFAYGVETLEDEIIYTETRGYNTCWLEGRKLVVHQNQVFPFYPVVLRFPIKMANRPHTPRD